MRMHEFGWSTAPLGDLCDVVMGRTPSRAVPEFWGPGHTWLSISDMGRGRYLSTSRESITDAGAAEFGGRKVKPGTVLMSFKLSIGKLGISAVPLYTNEAIVALPVIDSGRIINEYLYYALEVIDLLEETDKASKGMTLNKSKIERLKIPVPSIDEQKSIINVLNKADAIRVKGQESIRRLDDLYASLSHRAFMGDLTVTEPAADAE